MGPDPATNLAAAASVDEDATLESPASGARPPAPGQWLHRFRLDKMLGQGGMGQVWEAWDPQLERWVAIKRLLTTDLASRQRFVREARLQAAIVHPGICPVFEVGQEAGEPYIVMPRLDGVTLDQAVEEAPLEYKLELMRQVAEAVHAAHQQGLIHRDLKPANIMVESPPDAPPRPVVLDFGIARPMGSDGLTASGEIVGTPAFMAPEQVEGRSVALDRRTDVYALGATLYRLLAGHPPYSAVGTPLLLSIVHDEPPRLALGNVPAEVEAIVFKCLEKEKDQRYDSTRGLAEDLGRYLAGEPVKARPVTRWVRFSKWMRRHRVAVRVTSIAALVALAALIWGGWAAFRSEARQEIARQFGAQIEEIEALVRYSHLVPLHDIRADHDQLRRRLDAIRPSLDDGDAVVRALASHALGRGHLALDELETAHGYLAAAYEMNPENPEFAADLGRVLSELYRERLTLVERTRDLGGRESLQEQLSNRLEHSFRKSGEQQNQWLQAFGDPARDLLAMQGPSGANDAVELDALRLFHEGEPEAALDLLDQAPSAPIWAYERLRLEGDIRRSWAVGLATDSETRPLGRQQLEQARRIYDQALAVAPSHAAVLRDAAQAAAMMVRLDLVEPEEAEPLFADARESLRQAMIIDPEDFRTWLWVARVESFAAYIQLGLARDPSESLNRALEAGNRAVQIDERASAGWLQVGRVYEMLARWRSSQGKNATREFEQAEKAFERVAARDRNYNYHVSLGTLRVVVAAQRVEQGLDASEAYLSAIASYRSAAEMNSAPFAALVNLALALFEVSSLNDATAQDMLHEANEILQQARALRPDHFASFYYSGLIWMRLARGGSAAQWIVHDDLAQTAQTHFERAIEMVPENFAPRVGLAQLLHLRAVSTHRRGGDASWLFAQARQAHGRALELAPEQSAVLLNLAWTAYFEGKFALREGHDPTALLGEAEDLCRQSLAIRRRPNALLCLGSVLRMEAEHYVRQVASAAADTAIAEAETIFHEMLDMTSDHGEAHRSLGRLLTLKAQLRRNDGDDPTLPLKQARMALDQALALEGDLIDFQTADAKWYLEKARWLIATGQDPTEVVESGRRRLAGMTYRERSVEVDRLQLDFDALLSPQDRPPPSR